MAKERFKGFVFRYRIMNKVQKLKELNKDSYDFTRASLEVQAIIRNDAENLVQKESAKY